MNAYELLELDRDADQREIERARRRALAKWHPDRNPGNRDAHQRFIAIQAAYDILSNTQTRQRYDAVLRMGHFAFGDSRAQTSRLDVAPGAGRGPQYWVARGLNAPQCLPQGEWSDQLRIVKRSQGGPDPRRVRVDGFRDLFDPALDRRLLDNVGIQPEHRASTSVESFMVGEIESRLRSMRAPRSSEAGVREARRVVADIAITFVSVELPADES